MVKLEVVRYRDVGPVWGVQPAQVVLFWATAANAFGMLCGSELADGMLMHEVARPQEHDASVDAAALTPFIEVSLSFLSREEAPSVYL